jgi:HK97 family phage major capsid protein
MRSKALRAQRAQIVADARKLIDKEAPSAEDMAAFDAAMAESDRIMKQVEALERHETIERELAASTALNPGAAIVVDPTKSNDPREVVAREKRLLTAYLRNGIGGMSEEDRTALAPRFTNAAMGTSGSMSVTIAPEFTRELFIAMKAQGGMRAAARVITTDTGVSLPFPMMDDRSNVATIIGENTAITEDTELAFTSVTLGAFTYKSGTLLISLQLLQDSAFDFDTIVRDAIAGRFVRKQNADYTTGAGTTLPRGVVLDAVSGKVGIVGQTTSVIYDDLVDTFHAVDPVYRNGASWMMNDSSVKVVRKLKDTQGHPLWQPSLTAGTPDSLLNCPVVVNQDVASMAANAKSILFGNFNNYIIRDTLDVQMLVLRERYADFLQVGYIAFCRSDGRLVSAANPIVWYQNSAT